MCPLTLVDLPAFFQELRDEIRIGRESVRG